MYCVITGASSGFGIEFSNYFASKGYNLCLVARNLGKLNSRKVEIQSEYNVEVDVVKVDISNQDEILALYEYTKYKNVDVLINNAGMSAGGMPYNIDVDRELMMIDTNIKSVHYLTRLYLKDMIKRNSGKILNVSSLSAWMPVPLLSAYSAGKAYILHFSEGLNFELKKMKSCVHVSVVTPGFFNTNIAGDGYSMADQKRSVREFIRKVSRRFLNGERVIIIGRDKLVPILCRFWPRFFMQVAMFNEVRKVIREV